MTSVFSISNHIFLTSILTIHDIVGLRSSYVCDFVPCFYKILFYRNFFRCSSLFFLHISSYFLIFFPFPRTSPILFRLERIGKCFYLGLCLVSFCILYFPFFCVSLLRISPRSFVYFVSCILPATGCIQLYASIFPILCLCICLPSLRFNVFFVFIRTRLLHIFFFIISMLFTVRLNGVDSLILRVKKYRRTMTNDISKIFQFLRFLSVSKKFARSKCAKYEKIYKTCKV